jgi:hypothetical protein
VRTGRNLLELRKPSRENILPLFSRADPGKNTIDVSIGAAD